MRRDARRWRTPIVAAVVAAAMSGCGVLSEQPSPIPTPLNRVVKVDHSATPDGVISYISERGNPAYTSSVEDPVEIASADDLDELDGAPDDFKRFLLAQLAEQGARVDAFLTMQGRSFATEDCDAKAELRVWGIAEQVATGRERACGMDSNDVIWAKVNGSWRRAARMQGGWDCSVLERYRVPADITAAVCWYDGGRKTRAYDGPDS